MEFAKDTEVSQNKAIVVGYWSIRGLAAPLRMMVMYAGKPLADESHVVFYDHKTSGFNRSGWMEGVKPVLKETQPLVNLPYVKIPGIDMIVTQSNACLSALGRHLGLWGKNEAEIIECEMLLSQAMDVRNAMVGFAYGSQKPAEDAASLLSRQTTAEGGGNFPKFEAWLEMQVTKFGHSGRFLVGDHATAPDFHLYEMLDQYSTMQEFYAVSPENNPAKSSKFPRLSAFYAGYSKDPCMQKYLECALSKYPFNNKMAEFGSAPNGAKFVPPEIEVGGEHETLIAKQY